MNPLSIPPEESDPHSKTVTYALLVGINTYTISPLQGPVNDVKKVADFLKTLTDIDTHIKILTDSEATKTALITAFREHLGQAKSGDTVLFYFSGHGTSERVDTTIWSDESSGVLECIACYNGDTTNSWDFLLADKELRYLLHEVAQEGKVHTVAIFDCCHSGDNTRSLLDLDAQDTRQRSIQDIFPLRPWTAFLFSSQISEEQAHSQPMPEWLPEPIHIQMSACAADEKALEVENEGVFTKNLLSVLQANSGAVSYESLIDHARQYMRFGYDQRPQLFASGSIPEKLKRSPFLNRSVNTELPAVQAQFSQSKNETQGGWYLNVGALHGLQPGQEVKLLTSIGQPLLTAPVSEVGLDYARLSIDSAVSVQPDPAIVYRVDVPGLMSKPLRIFFSSRNGSPAEQAKMITNLMAGAGSCYVPEEDESAADYALYARNGWYFLTLPNTEDQPDNEFRPLVSPVMFTDKNVNQKLGNYIRQFSRWTYLKTLKNPVATGPGVKIEVVPEGSSSVAHNGPIVPITLIERDETHTNEVVVRVTNTTNQLLYCTVVYLTHGIGSWLQFLDTNTELVPNQVVIIGQNAYEGADNSTRISIPISSAGENVVHDYNWPAVDERLLFIFTTKSANASGVLSESTLNFLQFDELPPPPTLADRMDGGTKAIAASRASTAVALPTWWTQSINLRWENPAYNKISKYDLHAMISPQPDTVADDALADCALGLYFTTSTNQSPTLQVKPQLQQYWINQQDGQKGLGEDISLALASRVSQSIRNRQFQENRTVYPNRARVVASGDSWFQYPFLIRDIVDCLSNGYLVYSLASTDNTLQTIEPNDVLQAIDESDAQFLLFSGGLNDLMDQFPDRFILDITDLPQTNPRQWLTDEFFQTLDAMQVQYESLFEVIRREKSNVYIIAHGYDYIRSVNAVSEERNWLAPELTRKGISSPQVQQDLLNLVIDEFNERLKTAADKFDDMVTYLDLRHIVAKPTYWHDETHPNDAGFLDLAYQFVKQIRTIQKPASATIH
ncbi:caspase family protein [Spirosoma endbachense]|uniref:Peptidase C14 caspase domain-containing protein n=1 Tax=Spirosoma endbachense TaxID=2666025 RepID=A0A6P1W650_9BACT|nr:caspase family protein [Spirosoma endbachense]QHV99517.1 hypothetical protein GJR95_32895 [Spirosoma endbachense]